MTNIVRFPLERTRPTTCGIQIRDPETSMKILRDIAPGMQAWAHECPRVGPRLVRKHAPCPACGQRESDEPQPPNSPTAA